LKGNKRNGNKRPRKLKVLPNRVYHLAEASNWLSIQRYGLLSASKLLDLAGVLGAEREQLERRQRLEHTELPNGVQIRDQRPMPPAGLEVCLVGMTPAEWYGLINARIFFWLDPDRLNRQRAACEPRAQVVLSIDTSGLVATYSGQLEVTPINTGNARRRPARRGAATFVPYAAWVESAWASETAALGTHERSRSVPPAELTVVDSVPDVMRFVVAVFELAAGQSFAPSDA
jgi:hypothetical protein